MGFSFVFDGELEGGQGLCGRHEHFVRGCLLLLLPTDIIVAPSSSAAFASTSRPALPAVSARAAQHAALLALLGSALKARRSSSVRRKFAAYSESLDKPPPWRARAPNPKEDDPMLPPPVWSAPLRSWEDIVLAGTRLLFWWISSSSGAVLMRGSTAASLSWLHHLHRTNTGQTLYKRVQVLALRILRGSDLGGSDLDRPCSCDLCRAWFRVRTVTASLREWRR